MTQTLLRTVDRAKAAELPNSDAPGSIAWLQHALNYPRLRENVWQIAPDEASAYVETLDGVFEVPTEQALSFTKIRTHFNGHNSIADISSRSGVPQQVVRSSIQSLFDAGLLAPPPQLVPDIVSAEDARQKLKQIGELWGRELTRHFVANELLSEPLPKDVLVGWLLEMYHYVKDFPEIIAEGGKGASGALGDLIRRYSSEEKGHEIFVVRTLQNFGLSRAEVEASTPLVSTRLISLLMRELLAYEPSAVLLVAAIIEAQETPEDQLEAFQRELEKKYDLAQGTMAPYFEHQFIDVALGHSKLLEDNFELFAVRETTRLNHIVDKMHDLKHAFELQSLEIKSYYGNLSGMYLPRQPATFVAL